MIRLSIAPRQSSLFVGLNPTMNVTQKTRSPNYIGKLKRTRPFLSKTSEQTFVFGKNNEHASLFSQKKFEPQPTIYIIEDKFNSNIDVTNDLDNYFISKPQDRIVTITLKKVGYNDNPP